MTTPSPSLAELRVDTDPTWSAAVVGVIGGLGPAATALFLQLVVDLTPATNDQEHLDLIVLDHSTTPDRTAAILDPSHPDPTPSLTRDAQRLEALGAAFISVPCNTAHHFFAEVEAAVSIPLVSIVDETAKAAQRRAAETSDADHAPRVAVLATDGTRSAGVYQGALEALGCEVLLPSTAQQELVMSVIYDGVKAGGPVDVTGLLAVVDALTEEGADVVVMGCTELSVVYAEQRWRSRPELVDSVESLAIATIRQAGRTPKL
ncbi:amino acid racemase [Leekyejoonella antrihumi]|uniref:Amino acid racemase n=2 Tax=Leekyejoonella antrihumi TaxID=1660198 RepID=A0A563DYU2_9MICO|nr:amino acid racemase [Leekyejoonella antrihumi]